MSTPTVSNEEPRGDNGTTRTVAYQLPTRSSALEFPIFTSEGVEVLGLSGWTILQSGWDAYKKYKVKVDAMNFEKLHL